MSELLPIPDSIQRGECAQIDLPAEASSFILGAEHKSYKHQFANIYYARLTLLKSIVEKKAKERWRGLSGSPPLVPRVLDVVKSQVCFIVGTVYIDMPQKPNVLEDVGRDRYLPVPAPRDKYLSSEDEIVLEDDSGRVQLVGEALQRVIDVVETNGDASESKQDDWGNVLVSGVIMAALGRETSSGAFEVKDVCFAGMAPMLYKNPDADENMEVDDAPDQWIAFVSGLEMGSESIGDPRIQMLVEYLSAEGGAQEDCTSQISRLMIAGDSLAPVAVTETKPSVIETGSKSKRFGQEASNFSPVPTNTLGDFLYDVASVMPVHLLAGPKDPSGSLLPQQPLPRAMFGDVKEFENFTCETNPVWLGLSTGSSSSTHEKVQQRSLFLHSGQAIEDMYKYVPSPPTTRLDLLCATLQWRHVAPTAPDTLWCYPYRNTDPFVLKRTPDLYVVGCQPEFATRLVSSNDFDDRPESDGEERKCRVVLVPTFKETGCLVLVNMRNLEVKLVEFGLAGRLKHADQGHSEDF